MMFWFNSQGVWVDISNHKKGCRYIQRPLRQAMILVVVGLSRLGNGSWAHVYVGWALHCMSWAW